MDIDALLKEVERQIATEAKTILGAYAKEAAGDGREFLQAIKDDLERWTAELAQGRLSQKEFRSLVEGTRDLAEMHVLKQKGAGRAAINRFTDSVMEAVVDAVFALLPF